MNGLRRAQHLFGPRLRAAPVRVQGDRADRGHRHDPLRPGAPEASRSSRRRRRSPTRSAASSPTIVSEIFAARAGSSSVAWPATGHCVRRESSGACSTLDRAGLAACGARLDPDSRRARPLTRAARPSRETVVSARREARDSATRGLACAVAQICRSPPDARRGRHSDGAPGDSPRRSDRPAGDEPSQCVESHDAGSSATDAASGHGASRASRSSRRAPPRSRPPRPQPLQLASSPVAHVVHSPRPCRAARSAARLAPSRAVRAGRRARPGPGRRSR